MSDLSSLKPSNVVTAALTEVGGLAIGLGLGILLGERVRSEAKRGTGFGLLAAGVISTLPFLVGAIVKNAGKRASNARHMRDRLDTIRDAGGIQSDTGIY